MTVKIIKMSIEQHIGNTIGQIDYLQHLNNKNNSENHILHFINISDEKKKISNITIHFNDNNISDFCTLIETYNYPNDNSILWQETKIIKKSSNTLHNLINTNNTNNINNTIANHTTNNTTNNTNDTTNHTNRINSTDPIISFFNKPPCGTYILNYLKNCNNWTNVEITKYHAYAKHICLFFDNSKIHIAHTNVIEILDDKKCISNYDTTIKVFLNHLADKKIIKIVDDKFVCFNENEIMFSKTYHFLLKHSSLKNICDYDGLQNNLKVSLLWINNNESNFIYTDDTNNDKNTTDCMGLIVNKIQFEKRNYFSCLDELLTSLDLLNDDNISSKNIQYAGYYLKIFNEKKTNLLPFRLNTEIYNYVKKLLPRNPNQHINFLELYQSDKLTDVLPYLHKYPTSVIKRINKSIRILAKEILNIYHLTRKKQNSELYECLPSIYKSILFNLHKIYVDQKYGDYIIKLNDDDLKEKKSISIDIVYGFLKNMKNYELIDLFESRSNLIKNLDQIKFDYSDVLCIDNIYIITQIELMFPKTLC